MGLPQTRGLSKKQLTVKHCTHIENNQDCESTVRTAPPRFLVRDGRFSSADRAPTAQFGGVRSHVVRSISVDSPSVRWSVAVSRLPRQDNRPMFQATLAAFWNWVHPIIEVFELLYCHVSGRHFPSCISHLPTPEVVELTLSGVDISSSRFRKAD